MPTYRQLIEIPKQVSSRRPRRKEKAGHWEIDLLLTCEEVDGELSVIVRMNKRLAESFSIILRYRETHLPFTILFRVNGDHGPHTNPDGKSVNGPHAHAPNAEEIDTLIRGPLELRYAEQISSKYTHIGFAWVLFRTRCHIEENPEVTKALTKLHTITHQENLDGLFDDT